MPRFLYTFLLYVLLPFVPIKLVWRGIKQPEYLQHWKERFGIYRVKASKPLIWLHCVSVGETRAAEPLVLRLQKQYPDHQILITHATPTGRATTRQLFKDSVLCVYLPYDLPFAVKKFITHFQPKIGILMETELWFNLIDTCHQSQVPLFLVNARLSEKSANGYAKLGGLVSNGLNQLTLIAAQTLEDENRFKILGANNTSVAGNLKFDVVAPEDAASKGLALRDLFGKDRLVFLAASTRDGEEALILDAVKGLNILTVIVPRHPQRFDEVEVLLNTKDVTYAVRSTLTKPIANNVQVVLGDTMGEMYTYYAACDFTFVGGSLLKFGGQNLIEAASMGKPILIGKYTYNFAEASKGAVKMGAATQVKDIEDLKAKLIFLTENVSKREQMSAAALSFCKTYTGATMRLLEEIGRYIR